MIAAVPADRKFPAGFLWGTASAAHQVEGGNRNNDWWRFEMQGGITTGDTAALACDHYNRFREDFRMLRQLNQTAHRLSIEWSRIEPERGQFDKSEIGHYRDVLTELRRVGISPMLTLHHFTSPIWFAEAGGWTASGSAEAFLRFVRVVSDELGELVNLWCTINEPNIYAANGWLTGEFPPARKGDLRGAYRVLANLRRAHEAAYALLKRQWPDSPVGLSHHKFLFMPASRRFQDRAAARSAQAAVDLWPVGRGRLRRVVEATSDYVGIAHYWGQLASFDLRYARDLFVRRFNVPGLHVTDMGWPSDPSWIRMVLEEVGGLGKPVYVTENGIATTDDLVRQRYLRAVLEQVLVAVRDGVDVRGYYHWTNMDNFEWARGYSAKFGLIEVDRKTLKRKPRESARMYARIAKANSLVD
jgi:beta-glucosidase